MNDDSNRSKRKTQNKNKSNKRKIRRRLYCAKTIDMLKLYDRRIYIIRSSLCVRSAVVYTWLDLRLIYIYIYIY